MACRADTGSGSTGAGHGQRGRGGGGGVGWLGGAHGRRVCVSARVSGPSAGSQGRRAGGGSALHMVLAPIWTLEEGAKRVRGPSSAQASARPVRPRPACAALSPSASTVGSHALALALRCASAVVLCVRLCVLCTQCASCACACGSVFPAAATRSRPRTGARSSPPPRRIKAPPRLCLMQ